MDVARGVLLAVLAAGCAPAPPPVGAARASVNGDVDTEGRFPGVMGLLVLRGDLVARCTAVLVAPNLLLTARHCVSPTTGGFVVCGESPLGDPYPPENAIATSEVTLPETRVGFVMGTRILVPPEGSDECGFDLAAIVLEGSGVDPGVATPYPPRVDTPPVAGQPFTAVGYGTTSSGGGLGTRRVLEGLAVACVPESGECHMQVQPTEWQGPDDAFCQADSGAPALDPDGRVIGVTSRGMSPCSTPVLASTYAFRDFLRSAGREAATLGGYPPPAWTAPEGGADAGVAVSDGGAGAGDASTETPASDGGCTVARGSHRGTGLVLGVGVAAVAFVRRRARRRSP